MSTVIGTQKFHALEVVDSAKFDNEIVFTDLTMDGGDLAIVTSGTFSVTSMATDSTTNTSIVFTGISMTAVEEVVVSSTTKNVSMLAGVAGATSNVAGVVVLGHQDTAGNTIAHVQAGFTSGGVDTLGVFGTTPVVQQASAVAAAVQSGAYIQADVQSIATLANAMRTALLAYGFIV